jgi:hypothetical protein
MVPQDIAGSRYVSLVTHRRNGTPVATPVWAVEDNGKLLVWTRVDSGKVKRLRKDTRVTVTPCDSRGRTAPDAQPSTATARLMDGAPASRGTAPAPQAGSGGRQDGPERLREGRLGELPRVRRAMARKYGWQFRVVDSGGALMRRGRRPHIGIELTF